MFSLLNILNSLLLDNNIAIYPMSFFSKILHYKYGIQNTYQDIFKCLIVIVAKKQKFYDGYGNAHRCTGLFYNVHTSSVSL